VQQLVSQSEVETYGSKGKHEDRMTRDTGADHARNELMKESLRRAEEIRRGLEGRKHSDSTILIAEDRTRRRLARTAQ
jgi:hypothetical protein